MKKKSSLGCLFYMALVLLVLVITLFSQKKVQEVIERTGFLQLFHRETIEKPSPPEVVITPLDPAASREEKPEKPGREREVVVEVKEAPVSPPKLPEKKPEGRERKGRLFFISVSPQGVISLKGVIRPIQFTDAPLRSTLAVLFEGPTPQEVNQGLITMIPKGTRILDLRMEGDTAVLNLNEAFRFNSLGREGLEAQLRQIVYSCTEFSNVKKVQILIEGKKVSNLGPEGVFIGNPISRDNFLH